LTVPELKGIELFPIVKPDFIDDFWLGGDAHIGIKGEIGADHFRFGLITPKKLLTIVQEKRIFNGRMMFVVNESDMKTNLALVKTEINKFLPECTRDTWEEVALAINNYLEWEYFDLSSGICAFYKKNMMNRRI